MYLAETLQSLITVTDHSYYLTGRRNQQSREAQLHQENTTQNNKTHVFLSSLSALCLTLWFSGTNQQSHVFIYTVGTKFKRWDDNSQWFI